MVDTLSLLYRCPSRQAMSLVRDMGLDVADEADLEACKRQQWGDLELPNYSFRNLGKDTSSYSIEEWHGSSPELGWVGVQRRDNTWTVKAERSLTKWMHGEDCRVLTAQEAQEAVYAYDAAIRAAAPFVHSESVTITRLDICWQTFVGDTVRAIEALYGALEPRHQKVTDRYETSLFMRSMSGGQRAFRAYDKGAESGNPEYRGVLRLEEQLRRGSALAKCADGLNINRETCRNLVNQRLKSFESAVLGDIPREQLIDEGKWTVLYLSENPEYIPTYKNKVKHSAYYETIKQVRRIRAGAVKRNLLLPDDAWITEEMG